VKLASRGLRDMDDGPERIENAEELSTVQRQATRVYRHAVVLALLLTLIALVVP
jgi:hypothetical protein